MLKSNEVYKSAEVNQNLCKLLLPVVLMIWCLLCTQGAVKSCSGAVQEPGISAAALPCC